MSPTGFDPSLRPYLPASYLDANGDLTVSDQQAQTVAKAVQAHVQSLPPAEQQLYLALLNSPDFTPGANISTADLDVDLNNLDHAEQKLAQIVQDTAVSNFLGLAEDVNALAKILVIQASQARDAAHQEQKSLLEAAKNDLMNQAAQQQTAANDLQTQAYKAMVLAVVGSAISIAGAAVQFGGAVKSFRQANKVDNEFGSVEKDLKLNLKRQSELTGETAEGTKTKTSSSEKLNKTKSKEADDKKADDQKLTDKKKTETQESESANKADSKKADAQKQTEEKKSQADDKAENEKEIAKNKELGELREKAQKLETEMKLKEAEMAPINRRDHLIAGGSQGIEKLGGLMSSVSNYYNQLGQSESQADQAIGTRFQALDQDAEAQADMQKDIQGHLDDLIKSMVAAAKDLQDAKAQAMESITRV